MQFILSSPRVRNAILTNESGQVLYKTTHPDGIGGTTTLHKIKPNDDPTDMRDEFDAVGKIKWNVIGSSVFHFNGQDKPAKEFLCVHGIRRRKRTFTGPDGCPYRWDILRHAVVLSRDDPSRTEVARYYRGSRGIIGRKRKPRLEVSPDVNHMLDLIILTFVFVEKIRIDKDRGQATGR